MSKKIENNVTNIEGWPIDVIKSHLKDHKVKKDVILKIVYTIIEYNKKVNSQPVDGVPCSDCGGNMFIRTGTCHACVTCGSSQGCS